MKKIALIIVTLAFIASSISFAHSGRTNKEGCHNDYKNDSYHCH